MSETLSQDPDGLGAAYTTLAPNYPPTPATPSSTVQDGPPGSNLPPFSTFASEMDPGATFNNDRLFGDTRLLDISNWDYYADGRLLERTENGLSIISSQPQYRPWESKPVDSSITATASINTFSEAFAANGASKLPSFQSQFQSFNEAVTTSEPTLTTLTNLTPVSPNSTSSPQNQSITTLNSSFHTLSARSYPLVPAPIQAREIPSIQQQFIDERHIQLYSHPINNSLHSASIFPQNGTIIQSPQIISSPTVVTVLKSDPELKLTPLNSESGIKIHQNVTLHPTQFQNPMATLTNSTDNGLYNGIEKKINEISNALSSPSRNDFRKKERRKIRASSLESSAESDGASSNMDMNNENSGQVAAVSSTDNGYKTNANMSMGMEHDMSGGPMDKQVKKKRKRCGECVGCQRKDNCGDCAPCRNDKSHQICKQRRCEKLTEKKNMFGEPYVREGGRGRGRGKGRGGGSYRGRKANGGPLAPLGSSSGGIPPPTEPNGASVAPPHQPATRLSPQLTTALQPMPVQQQPMTPMPFYADPNRFGTPVWQADPTQGWTQGQFIQQIPTASQPIETYQQYPNGIYQATYQQPTFETTNTFYTAQPVQVLTNTRPPSIPNQQTQMIPTRPNSNYAHTPSPSPAGQANQQNQNQQQYNQFSGQNGTDSNSRPSSVNSVVNQNPGTPNQNFNQQQTLVNQQNFSPSSNQQNQFAGSGNGQPGYPQVNASSPQASASHNSSGYPGEEQYGGQQTNHEQAWQQEQMMWEHQPNQQQQVHDSNNRNNQQQQHQQSYQQQVNEQQQQQHHQEQQYNNMGQQQQNHSNMSRNQTELQQKTFSQAEKINLNTRIKTMILNKQQNESRVGEDMKNSNEQQQNNTGHFLWYSHHQHVKASVDGGSKHKSDEKAYYTHEIAQSNSKTLNTNVNCKNFTAKDHNYNEQYLKYVRNSAHGSVEKNKTPERCVQYSVNQNSFNVVNHIRDSQKHQDESISENKTKSPIEKIVSHHIFTHKPMEKSNYDMTKEILLHQPQYYSDIRQFYREDSDSTFDCKKQTARAGVSDRYSNRNHLHENSGSFIKQEDIDPHQYAASGHDHHYHQTNSEKQQILQSSTRACTPMDYRENYMTPPRNTPCPENYLSPPSKDHTNNLSLITPPYTPKNKSASPQKSPYAYHDLPVLSKLKCSNSAPSPDSNAYNILRYQSPSPNSRGYTKTNYPSPSPDARGYNQPSYPQDPGGYNTSSNFLPLHDSKGYNQRSFSSPSPNSKSSKKPKAEKQPPPTKVGEDIPQCQCVPKDHQMPPEPGTYYTHLGCANNMKTLRHNLECQTGVTGTAIRIEKVQYTGKEGKTAEGCPIVKWVHRRVSLEEKYLVIVKHRSGHSCHSAFIIVCLVVWQGIPLLAADDLYSTLTEKLNKFGLPTKRRCATNDTRTCACQGINEDTCGASFSFGCSWSMYYNGCKFTRSKDVRKFRMSVKEEEEILEDKFTKLADHINPMYKRLAPNSFENQTRFENIAPECRLGNNPGRPFSGVTACIDFCAHAHKDIHNMNNGCTVVVTLTKHRELTKPEDEQLHVLPLYIPVETDEFDSKESQEMKVATGQIEVLSRYNCEVRTYSEPASTCRALRKEKVSKKRKSSQIQGSSTIKFPIKSEPVHNSEIQNGHISSTVMDHPSWRYDNFQNASYNKNSIGYSTSIDNNFSSHLPEFSMLKNAYPYPKGFSNHYNSNGFLQNSYSISNSHLQYNSPTSKLSSHFNHAHKNSNLFDDYHHRNLLPPPSSSCVKPRENSETKCKSVDIRYTDNSECFKNKEIGGVAIALTHGSVLFECAKHELHATTAVKKPNRQNPTRISLVFYQHRNLNKSQHGLDDYTLKQKNKMEGFPIEPFFDTSGYKCSVNTSVESNSELMQRTATLPTNSLTTMFPMHPCIITGPYQEFLASSIKMPND